MKAYDVVGYTHDGEVLCCECADEDERIDDEQTPVFASEEGWETMSCGGCLHTLACAAGVEERCGACEVES